MAGSTVLKYSLHGRFLVKYCLSQGISELVVNAMVVREETRFSVCPKNYLWVETT